MDTFRSIIEFAIRNEDAEARFYERLAARAGSADLREILLDNARQEREHKARLVVVLEEGRVEVGRHFSEEDLKISDYTIVVPTGDEPIGLQDALIQAAKREMMAQRLYGDLAARAKEPHLRALLTMLSDEEGKHKGALERRYDDEVLGGNE